MTHQSSKSLRISLSLGLAVLATTHIAAVAASLPVTMHTIHQARPGYYDAKATYAQISGTSPVVRLANKALKLAVMQRIRDFRQETAQELHQRPTAPYQLLATTSVWSATPTLVSASVETYLYEGGAHGLTVHTVVNIGIVRGKVKALSLQDLFHPMVNGIAVTKGIVFAILKQDPQANFVQDGTVKALTPQLISRFVVRPMGVMFLFDPYDVGPYSSGSLRVSVTFAGFGTNLDPNGPLKLLL